MRIQGYRTVALAGLIAVTAWILSQSEFVDASEEGGASVPSESVRPDRLSPGHQPAGIRLNYFDVRWNRVLNDVCRQAGLTLVMNQTPPGHFARRDRARYSTADSLQILNRELELLGYQLQIHDRHLIVLKRSDRPETQRPAGVF